MQLGNTLGGNLELQQRLALNAGLLQSLEVLRLPMQELTAFLLEQTYENPLLELGEGSSPETVAETTVRTEDVGETVDADEAFTLESAEHDIWSAGPAGGDVYLAAGASEETFAEMLEEQINALHLDSGMAALCRYLVACLDRKGYFTEPPEDIAELLQCSVFDVMQALYIVQSLEPAGVGARGLEECLLLQLMHSRHFNQYTIRLVKDGMALLAAGDMAGIETLLEADAETTKEACCIVRALNPIPSQGYFTGETRQTVIPDAEVTKMDGGFHVLYNRRSLPVLVLNQDYVGMIGQTIDSVTRDYLRSHLNDARQLVKSMEKRENTLTRIISEMVRRQPGYFEDGQSIVPMTLEAIASELDLNISTISRAVQGKYIKCTAGTVEMKSLFTAGLKRQDGSEVSAFMVKRMLQDFIRAEDPAKPLSDESIKNSFTLAKIDISRRTIAKYREELGIPSSSARRQRG